MSGSFLLNPGGSEKNFHHRGDVFTPNTLLICQQDSSTIHGGDIKPAKTHLYADNMALYTAALIKPLKCSKLLFKHISFHFYSYSARGSSCTVSLFQHRVCLHMAVQNCLFFLLNYVLICPYDLCGFTAGKWESGHLYLQKTSSVNN